MCAAVGIFSKGSFMETKKTIECDEANLQYIGKHQPASYSSKLIGAAICFVVIVVMFVLLGIKGYFQSKALLIICIVLAAAYLASAGIQIYQAVVGFKYPHSIVIDNKHLILREKFKYHYIKLDEIGRLRIQCEGLDSETKGNGSFDIDIVESELRYTWDGKKKGVVSRNMRKVAFVLTHLLNNLDSGTNWGLAYESAAREALKNI